MENLFRLLLVRPAIAQDPPNPSIDLSRGTPYQVELQQLVAAGGNVRVGLVAVSTAYVEGPNFIGLPAQNPVADALTALARRLDELETLVATPDAVTHAIKDAFGVDAAQAVSSPEFSDTLPRLGDSLVAIKILQAEHGRQIEELTKQLRTMEVVRRVAEDGAFPHDVSALRKWRRRSLRLPVSLGLTSGLSTKGAEAKLRKERAAQLETRRSAVADLLAQHAQLSLAIKGLSSLPSSHLQVSPQADSPTAMPPDRVRLMSEVSGTADYIAQVRGLHLEQLKRTVDAGKPGIAAAGVQVEGGPVADLAKTLLAAPAQALPGRNVFIAATLVESGFVLGPNATAALPKGTQTLLAERGIDLTKVALDKITEQLQAELGATVVRLEEVAGHPVKQSFTRVGDALVSIQTPLAIDWGAIASGGTLPIPPLAFTGQVPNTKGDVAPSGVADLIVVKQQLTGYEGTDVAHIENVLKGESKGREHSRRETTETVTLTETEVTTSDEKELSTTDRFEMTRETSATIKEDVSAKAGLQISGKYGPTVEFAASAEGSFQRSKEEATKSATTFAKDVTERSAHKIAERVLTRIQTTITTETLEKNTHELDNTTGGGHISGVYQWVDKIYQAQLFNYGLRAMFDFMVPEPAAFLIAAMTMAHNGAVNLVKPPPFALTPGQITESNYGYWAMITRATDVTPPPEIYRTKTADLNKGGGDHDTNYNHSGQITLDDGYRAIFGSLGVVRDIWESDNTVDVVLGRRTNRLGDSDWMWTTTLDDERDSIPFAIDTFHCSQVAVAIEVKCQRTDRAMDKWRLETHAKLTTAHKALETDYEEKLAALQMQSGIAIHGNNPRANLVTVQAELKKNCLSILTDQHFDLFGAIQTSPSNGLPEIDVAEAALEGTYVRFFEQAFEWEHVTYVTYPYFWGRKDQWDERLGYDDPDPAFAEFLRAGYCRVSVPARPGFEGAIDHFLTFGEIWNGGPLPTISNPLYLPIADEISERLGRPGTETPQGDPWTVRVPTSLVHLRADDQLPKWTQNAAGDWVEN